MTMVGVGVCTPTIANVCLGDEEVVVEFDHMSLAEYRACSDSTYPAGFGGRVLSTFDETDTTGDSSSSPNPADLGFLHADSESVASEPSSDVHEISQSCFEMLEK